jgi:hypothetical protein
VLFREENLERLNETYPISYLLRADVLDAIKAHDPRGVFVDFVFLDKARPGSEAKQRRVEDSRRLKDAICGLSRVGKRPVYLAVDLEGHSGIAAELVEEGRPCVIKVTPEMEDAFGVGGVLTYANGIETPGGFLRARETWVKGATQSKSTDRPGGGHARGAAGVGMWHDGQGG